jgi:hypothetical protein
MAHIPINIAHNPRSLVDLILANFCKGLSGTLAGTEASTGLTESSGVLTMRTA